jgi:hypothetical protein
MMSGIRDLGDPGRLVGAGTEPSGLDLVLSPVWILVFDKVLDRGIFSECSSNEGPVMHLTMFSPKGFCRQLLPGALIDLSCTGGRPGIVAVSFLISVTCTNRIEPRLTRIHGYFLHRCHSPHFGYAYFASSSSNGGLVLGF